MELLLALVLTPIVIVVGGIILIGIYTYLSDKYNKNIANLFIIVIAVLIFGSYIGGNIKDNSERSQSYEGYRNSTGKEYMTDTEINKAMMDEAKWKSDMEEKLNK